MLWTLLILMFILADVYHQNNSVRKPTNYEEMFLVMDLMDSEDEGL